MDGANEQAKRRILGLFDLRGKAEEIQGTFPEKKEIIISVNLASGIGALIPPEEPSDSRIWCDYLLLGGSRKLMESELPIKIQDFYFPILSAERQKRTFMTLLALLSDSEAKISAPILDKPRKFLARTLNSFGWPLKGANEQTIYKLLIWSKLAQDKGIPLSVFKQEGPLEIPERAWIVSDPWNQIELIKRLSEKQAQHSSEIDWYQVTIVQKNINAIRPEKQFGIAS